MINVRKRVKEVQSGLDIYTPTVLENGIEMPINLYNYVHIDEWRAEYAFLYMVLLRDYDEEVGCVYTPIKEIVEKYGRSERVVYRHLHVLEKLGLIVTLRESGHLNLYVILKPKTLKDIEALGYTINREYKN